MTFHRHPVGRDRWFAALGAVVMLVGCALPWWTVGGSDGLPVRSGNAFDGSGILVFVAALATLAVVTLPQAAGRTVAVDSWPVYTLVAVVGWLGLALRVWALLTAGAFGFAQPLEAFTKGPGLWVAGIGLLILSRAAYRIRSEPDRY